MVLDLWEQRLTGLILYSGPTGGAVEQLYPQSAHHLTDTQLALH